MHPKPFLFIFIRNVKGKYLKAKVVKEPNKLKCYIIKRDIHGQIHRIPNICITKHNQSLLRMWHSFVFRVKKETSKERFWQWKHFTTSCYSFSSNMFVNKNKRFFKEYLKNALQNCVMRISCPKLFWVRMKLDEVLYY